MTVGCSESPNTQEPERSNKPVKGHATRKISPDIKGIQYQRKQGSDRLIIFIHGITGNSYDTWKNQRTDAFWPELLEKDNTFNDTDIAVFGYNTSLLGSHGSIDDITDNLRLHIEAEKINDKYKDVVFLCHSMGGLIVRSFVLRYRDLLKIKMIHFFSTPTQGADIANLATLISDNEQLEGMKEIQKNRLLKNMMTSWLSSKAHKEIKSYCSYELLDTKGVRIVPMASATALINQRFDPIEENHINIVKPADTRSASYLSFAVAYSETFKRDRITDSTLNYSLKSGNVSPLKSSKILVANHLEVDGFELIIPEGALIIANTIDLKNNAKIKGNKFSIISGSIIGGHLDASALPGKNGGEILIASGLINGTTISATGGNGEPGANGANGIHGGNGRDGQNGDCRGFNQWKKAKTGGSGENGTDGGDGRNGGNGGNGGIVHLISLTPHNVASDVSGGNGGAPGLGGQAGRGGKGGKGGKGCSGLGGTQNNAQNGQDGRDGYAGRDGVPGVNGENGLIFTRTINDLSDISRHVPQADDLEDYKEKIINILKDMAEKNI